MKRLALLLVLVLAFVAYQYSVDPARPAQTANRSLSALPEPRTPMPLRETLPDSSDVLLKKLEDTLGERHSALAVARVLGDNCGTLLKDERLLDQASHLGSSPKIRGLLSTHPQCLGVLLVLEPPQRQRFADGLFSVASHDKQELLISCCLKYAESAPLRRWAEAVGRHAQLMADLLSLSPVWPVEKIFAFEWSNTTSDQAVAEAYDHWLKEVITPGGKLRTRDETASILQFVIQTGPVVWQLMKDEPTFRARLPREIWGRVSRSIERLSASQQQGPLWHLCGSRSLWKLMERPDGEELFARKGELAADLLCGDDAGVLLPPPLRDRAAAAILHGNDVLLCGLMRYARHPDFLHLAARLADEPLAIACVELNKSGDSVADRLAYWHGIRDTGELISDLGPPPSELLMAIPYAPLVYCAYKYSKGREVSLVELASALYGARTTTVNLMKANSMSQVADTLLQEFSENVGNVTGRGAVEVAAGPLSAPVVARVEENASGPKPVANDPMQAYEAIRRSPLTVASALDAGPLALSGESLRATHSSPALAKDIGMPLSTVHASFYQITPFRACLKLDDSPSETPYRRAAKEAAEACLANRDNHDAWQAHVAAWLMHLAFSSHD